MAALINMIGKKFGSLLVLSRAPARYSKKNIKFSDTWYNVLCDCGKTAVAGGCALRSGGTSGCDKCKPRGLRHGFRGTKEYQFWNAAKQRAKHLGIKFKLEPSDIHIPDKCPLLEI